MTVLIDKTSLYSIFGVACFDELETTIDTLSPSMTEYYLSDIASDEEMIELSQKNVLLQKFGFL